MVISNVNLLQICKDCGATGFTPAVSFVYDSGAQTITFTNSSTIPSGDTFSRMKIRVSDFFGTEVRGTQTVQATALVISTSTLNLAKPIMITGSIFTANQIAADGSASGVLTAAGNLGFFDVQKNA